MIVITLTDSPLALRGDLTKWLFEVDTNLYVGKLSSRVRDELWDRITKFIQHGRATMVYNVNNEQGFDFRTCGNTWIPVDFEGLKLMLRPNPMQEQNTIDLKPGFSKASKRLQAKRRIKSNRKLPNTYVLVDVETTGLSASEHEIIEIGALKIYDGQEGEPFQELIVPKGKVPEKIEELTGLTNRLLMEKGRDIREVMQEFITFISDLPIVAHNAKFDYDFLRKACEKNRLPLIKNEYIDTLSLAKKVLDDPPSLKLKSLLDYLELAPEIELKAHRGLNDCGLTKLLYDKLFELIQGD
ncbi:MAG: type I-E CRISPR-associated endoribonuclease Cas2e [Lachnospiraceae bacterium]|jgi:CRISPR-associated protein Cas2|nr:type I-E CRISPR-associated endoribonuclease Cas2e [Lachnospiraceae bacterium]